MEHIDIRSDTVTVPTIKMRQAMRDAVVGDDVYGEDPTINQLVQKATKIFKKEAGIFVSSGVMGNQLAVMSWTSPGDQIILWDKCHIIDMENGSISLLAGVQARTVESETGQLTAQDVEPYIRTQKKIHVPKTSLLCLQNSLGNGRVYSTTTLNGLRKLADKHDLKIHTDGARIFNAAATLGLQVSELAKHTDSISFCLSKGLCCPYGSILLGTKEFIERAKVNRKAIGGGIREGGFLAAAGIVALDQIVPHISQDNRIAKSLAQKLSSIQDIKIDLRSIVSNIIFFSFNSKVKNTESLHEYLLEKKIKFNPQKPDGTFRIITHYYIREREVEQIVQELTTFIELNRR